MNKSYFSDIIYFGKRKSDPESGMKYGLIISWFFLLNSIILLTACNKGFKDSEGNQYKVVKIGSQVWMAENLNVGHFRNGDPIPEVQGIREWESAGLEGKPACCYFENKTENGKKYGKLYNWYAVIDQRGFVPEGWHLPDGNEWAELIRNLGGESVAADKLKTIYGWNMGCNGTNSSGFSGLPGGYRHYSGGFNKYDPTGGAYWWGSSEGFIYITCSYPVYQSTGGENRSFTSKARGFSVRLIRD